MPFNPTEYLPYDFANRRHIGPSPEEMDAMLDVVGAESLEALIEDTVPASIRQASELDFGRPLSERELLFQMREVASKNQLMTSLIGQGYHGTVTPPAIQRNILENPAWYTAYTPYQPEISQGRLEALLNFQTMVSDFTGMDIANASLLDEATAAAEAATAAISTASPALAEVIPATEVQIGFCFRFRNRYRSGRGGGGCDHLGHRGRGRGRLALDLRIHLLLVHGVLLRRTSLIGHDGRRFDEEIREENEQKNEDHEGDHQQGDHNAGDDGISPLRFEACLCFRT